MGLLCKTYVQVALISILLLQRLEVGKIEWFIKDSSIWGNEPLRRLVPNRPGVRVFGSTCGIMTPGALVPLTPPLITVLRLTRIYHLIKKTNASAE